MVSRPLLLPAPYQWFAGIALAYGYVKRMGLGRGEYYTLLLFSVTGMMLMAQATDLIIVFLALELLSIPLYVLAAFARPKPGSEEAGMKYFLLGAFSTGFVVYGIALIFGATQSTNLAAIVAASTGAPALRRLSGVPAPDHRSGSDPDRIRFQSTRPFPSTCGHRMCIRAPTAVTAFMSSGARCWLRGPAACICDRSPSISVDMTDITGRSPLTMVVGNVIAIAQSDIKRLLAYSVLHMQAIS